MLMQSINLIFTNLILNVDAKYCPLFRHVPETDVGFEAVKYGDTPPD